MAYNNSYRPRQQYDHDKRKNEIIDSLHNPDDENLQFIETERTNYRGKYFDVVAQKKFFDMEDRPWYFIKFRLRQSTIPNSPIKISIRINTYYKDYVIKLFEEGFFKEKLSDKIKLTDFENGDYVNYNLEYDNEYTANLKMVYNRVLDCLNQAGVLITPLYIADFNKREQERLEQEELEKLEDFEATQDDFPVLGEAKTTPSEQPSGLTFSEITQMSVGEVQQNSPTLETIPEVDESSDEDAELVNAAENQTPASTRNPTPIPQPIKEIEIVNPLEDVRDVISPILEVELSSSSPRTTPVPETEVQTSPVQYVQNQTFQSPVVFNHIGFPVSQHTLKMQFDNLQMMQKMFDEFQQRLNFAIADYNGNYNLYFANHGKPNFNPTPSPSPTPAPAVDPSSDSDSDSEEKVETPRRKSWADDE